MLCMSALAASLVVPLRRKQEEQAFNKVCIMQDRKHYLIQYCDQLEL